MGLSSSHDDEDPSTTPAEAPLAITEELNRKVVTLGWDCGEPAVVVSLEECINRFKEWKGDRKIEWDPSDIIVVNDMGEEVDFEDVPTLPISSSPDNDTAPTVVVILAAISLCCPLTSIPSPESEPFSHEAALTTAFVSSLCIVLLEINAEDKSESSKGRTQGSLSRTSSTVSSIGTAGTTEPDQCNGVLPPTINRIDPPFGAVGSSVLIHGSLFGGCSIADLKVLCGLHDDSVPKLEGRPVVATDVERLSSKLLRVRVPDGVRSSFPILVTSPFGRSPKSNLPHFRIVENDISKSICVTSAQIDQGQLTLLGRNFTPPLTITVSGHTVPHSLESITDTELCVPLPSLEECDITSGIPIVVYNDTSSCCYIHNPKKVARNMRGRSGSYIPNIVGNQLVDRTPESSTFWVVPPKSMMWHGVSMQKVIRVMFKLRKLDQYRTDSTTFRQPIPEQYLLTLEDFQSLCKSQELREQYFFYRTQPGSIATAPLFKSICQSLWTQAEEFKLMDVAVRGYNDGDVLFYDLQNRAALGDIDLRDRWSSAFYRLQKGYDRYSHSGIFVRRSGKASRPAIFHGLRTRVKDLVVPAAFSYMLKREVDLSKVFFRFQFLPEEMRETMYFWYREGIVVRSRQGQLILNDCADLWDIVTVVNSVPTERKKSLTQVGEHQRRGSVAKIMCSAFTASVLLETFLEVQNRLHAIADQEFDSTLASCYKSVQVHPSLLVDTLAVAPKLLHQWNIWRDQLQEEPGLLQIAAADVRTSFELLQSLQVREVT
eukprot:TRINITY_DN2742_c0_g4_i2.p1 TRINITY_DN2742_c0_g4~~TRINITY_DN2742_c0_g4_i2.p1  ORF type:complete len:796 (+),score=131.04 TRINITY_DN2742_c0_g4_i2:76-2388(+)